MAYVYKHIRLDTNEVFYIGIGKSKRRITTTYDRSGWWHNVVNKAGFIAEIIENELSWETACEREKYWIKFYGRRDLKEGNLVNMTNGGDGGFGMVHTDETKRKLSEISNNMSIETKRKIGDASRGRIFSDEHKQKIGNANRGKIRNAEVLHILSESHKGYTHTDEQKRKISESLKGRTISEETKKKIGLANTGRIASKETKRKMSEVRINKYKK